MNLTATICDFYQFLRRSQRLYVIFLTLSVQCKEYFYDICAANKRGKPKLLSKLRYHSIILAGILFLLAIPFCTWAQNFDYLNLKEYHYDGNDGLQSELTKAIVRDNFGFIWIATDKGLIRFDGNNFIRYDQELPSEVIKDLLLHSNGMIYVSTDLGLSQIKPSAQEPAFKTIFHGLTHASDTALWYPKQLYEDDQGDLWISDNNSVWKMQGQDFTQFRFRQEDICSNVQRSFEISQDFKGNFFIVSPVSNIYFSKDGQQFDSLSWAHENSGLHFASAEITPDKLIISNEKGVFILSTFFVLEKKMEITQKVNELFDLSCMLPLDNDNYLAGSWTQGIGHVQIKRGEFITVTAVDGIHQNNINALTLENNQLWISSDNGIIMAESPFFKAVYGDLSRQYIQNISEAPDGNIYFTDGNTLFKIDSKNKAIPFFNTDGSSIILRIITGQKNISLCMNNGHLIKINYTNGNETDRLDLSSSGSAIFTGIEDKSKNLWLCQDGYEGLISITPDGIIKYFNKDSGISSRIVCVAEADDGSIWAGGLHDSAYLFRKDNDSKSFKNISKGIPFFHNTDLNINEIIPTGDEKAWLASSFGLLHFGNDSLHRVHLGQHTETAIKSLVKGRKDNLWMAVSSGVIRIQKDALLEYNENNGLPSKTVGYRDLFADSYGRIWAGTVEGLAFAYDTKPDTCHSPVLIEAFKNRDSDIILNSSISATNKDYLKFNFFTPEYPGNAIKYQYRIIAEGQPGADWQEATSQIEIYPNELPTGTLSFEIRARKSGNFIWSPPLKLNLTISYPWYLDIVYWFFIITGLALLIVIIIHLNSIRMKRIQIRLERIITESTETLREQKNQLEEQKELISKANEKLKKKNHELVLANEKANEAAHSKSLFLSTMSHELRTPMNAVIGLAYILLQEDPKPSQIANLKTLKFSGENLLALINDILDFSKIEANKIQLEEADFNIKDLCQNLKNVFQFKIDEKQLKFILKIDENVPDFLVGDPTRLNQILSNLLSNAVKFTEKGDIDLIINKKGETDQRIIIEFCVKDTGIGIEKEKQEEIFNSFTQASSSTTRKYGGTGLGLSITKKLLELHNSKISLDSEPGKGSRFYFDISFRKSEKQLTSAPSSEELFKLIQFRQEKVLLVDDNQVNLIVARKFLKQWNLEITMARNGKEAVDLVSQNTFDLVLMDLQMPEMNGYDAAKTIREMNGDYYKNLPIIALTASALLEVKEKVRKFGMNDSVTKPFVPAVLNATIARYLHKTDL